MTLKRLLIIVGILVVFAGGGIAWLWQYAYSPQGRALVIIAQLKNDTTSLRGWMLQHHVVRPGFWVQYGNTPRRTPAGFSADSDMRYFPLDAAIFAASDAMVRLGGDAQPFAVEALRDGNHDARLMAIVACGNFRDPTAIQPLAQCMRDATVPQSQPPPDSITLKEYMHVQGYCLNSLVEIGPKAIDPLIEASKNCMVEVRAAIPGILADRFGAAALPQLIRLIDDPEASVRAGAATALGGLKDERAIDPLIRHLRDADSIAGRNAAEGLAQIACDLPDTADTKITAALLDTVKDGHISDTVRLSAADFLARKGREEELPFLAAMVDSSDPGDRCKAAELLGEIQSKDAFGPLLLLLDDNDGDVSLKAMDSLRTRQDGRLVPAMEELLENPDSSLRYLAADTLEGLKVKLPPARHYENPYSDLKPVVGQAPSTRPASNPMTTAVADEMRIFSSYEMQLLVACVGPKRYVAIVEFQSAFDSSGDALTKIVRDESLRPKWDQERLLIDGQMKLIQSFAAAPPPLGRIQGKFSVSMNNLGSPQAGSAQVRLSGFLGSLGYEMWPAGTNPKKAIAVGNPRAKNVLDGRFFGPIPDDQVENCKQLLACLVKMPYFRISQADARKILKSPNPFMVWLGILRLSDDQYKESWIGPADYFTAMRSVPVAFLPELAREMSGHLDVKKDPKVPGTVAKETLAFLREADPGRQLALLDFLNEGLGMTSYDSHFSDWLKPGKELTDGIQDLIDKRQGLKEWQPTVAEYRKLLWLLNDPATPIGPSAAGK